MLLDVGLFIVSFCFGFGVSMTLYLRMQIKRFKKEQARSAGIGKGTALAIRRNCVAYASVNCTEVTGYLQVGQIVVATDVVSEVTGKLMVPIQMPTSTPGMPANTPGAIPLAAVQPYNMELPAAEHMASMNSGSTGGGKTLLQSRSLESLAVESYKSEDQSPKLNEPVSPAAQAQTPSSAKSEEKMPEVVPVPSDNEASAAPSAELGEADDAVNALAKPVDAGMCATEQVIIETPRWSYTTPRETPRQDLGAACWSSGTASFTKLCAPAFGSGRTGPRNGVYAAGDLG